MEVVDAQIYIKTLIPNRPEAQYLHRGKRPLRDEPEDDCIRYELHARDGKRPLRDEPIEESIADQVYHQRNGKRPLHPWFFSLDFIKSLVTDLQVACNRHTSQL